MESPKPVQSSDRLSPSARRARVARFAREAPTLQRSRRGNYGAFATALAACLVLAGLTFFERIAAHFEDRDDAQSDLVEVEMATPEDLLPRTQLTEAIAAQLAADLAAEAAAREAVLESLASADLLSDEASESTDSEETTTRREVVPDTSAFRNTRDFQLVLPEDLGRDHLLGDLRQYDPALEAAE